MSLILDALRKADAERQSRERPAGLDTQPAATETAGNQWRWGLVAVLLVVVSLALGWWLRPVPEVAGTAPVAVDRIEPRPTRELAPPPGSEPAPETASEATSEPRLQKLYDRARPSAGADRAETEATGTEAPPTTPDLETIASLYRQEAPAAPDDNSASPGADTGSADSSPAAAVGAIRDLPLSVQNRIPTLMYAAHDYLEGSRPSVVFNGQRYYEGQTLERGLRLERIEEDGVIIRVDDHRFKLRALSSWVNM